MKIGRVCYKNKLYKLLKQILIFKSFIGRYHTLNKWINKLRCQIKLAKHTETPFRRHILKTCMIFKSVQNGNKTFNTCIYHLLIESICKKKNVDSWQMSSRNFILYQNSAFENEHCMIFSNRVL